RAAPAAGHAMWRPGERDPPAPAAAGGLPGRGDRPGHLPATRPDPWPAGSGPAGSRAGGRRARGAAGRAERDRPVDDGGVRAASPAGRAADRPGGGDRRPGGDPLRDPHHHPQHQDTVLSLAYRLFPDRTYGHTPATPGPDPARSPQGRPTTATAPSAAACGP